MKKHRIGQLAITPSHPDWSYYAKVVRHFGKKDEERDDNTSEWELISKQLWMLRSKIIINVWCNISVLFVFELGCWKLYIKNFYAILPLLIHWELVFLNSKLHTIIKYKSKQGEKIIKQPNLCLTTKELYENSRIVTKVSILDDKNYQTNIFIFSFLNRRNVLFR